MRQGKNSLSLDLTPQKPNMCPCKKRTLTQETFFMSVLYRAERVKNSNVSWSKCCFNTEQTRNFLKITPPPYKKNILKIAKQKTPTKNAIGNHSINKTFQLLTTKSIKQTQHCCDVINHK